MKCIYIDPPYNTRSAFEHYDDNLEHSQWLAMIYPRLVLLRELLADAGSIWVSIDDTEGHYLKVAMDEVFGRRNFVANIVWQKAYTSNQTAKHLSDTHDHLLLYAKDADALKIGKLSRTIEQEATFKTRIATLGGFGRPKIFQRGSSTAPGSLLSQSLPAWNLGRQSTVTGDATKSNINLSWRITA